MDRFWDEKLLKILEMPADKVEVAIKILQTLSVAAGPINFEAFCEILAIDAHVEDGMDRCNLYSDPNELLALCPGLVGFSTVLIKGPQPERWPNLVHPSIREYLFSKRIEQATSIVSDFSMNEDKANSDMAEKCIAYLLQMRPASSLRESDIAKYKFLPYAATFWDLHVKKIKCPLSSHLESQIFQLLTSGQRNFDIWLQEYDPDIEKGRQPYAGPFPSPLYYASLLGYPIAVSESLDRGAVLDEPRGKHRYPLLAAIESGHEVVARLLIDRGANIEVRYKNKDPAIVRAVQKGHENIVALLMEKGAGVNTPNRHGETPVHCAITYGRERKGHVGILRLLLNAGANPEAKNHFGRTPLHHAVTHAGGELVQLLLDAGVDIEARDQDEQTPLHHAACSEEAAMRCLLAEGADIEAKNYNGSTPLFEAIYRDSQQELSLLLQHGANVHVQDQKGWTVLHYASKNGYERDSKLLLQYGADFEKKTDEYETCLHFAALGYYFSVVRLLIEHGVEVNAKDIHGQTALHLWLKVSTISPITRSEGLPRRWQRID